VRPKGDEFFKDGALKAHLTAIWQSPCTAVPAAYHLQKFLNFSLVKIF